MRKLGILLFSALAVMSTAVSAQEGQSNIELPKAGDIAVGIEASPILDFVGNMFNGTVGQQSNSRWAKQNYTLHGRYFLADDLAVRAHLRLNSADNKTIERHFVVDQAALIKNPLSQDKVEDKKVSYNNEWGLAVGAQQFRGQGRLRGFYGADLGYTYESSSTFYYFGNKMTELNPTPTTHTGWFGANPNERTISQQNSGEHKLGVMAFAGAEYYFMSRACIGFEVGLSLYGAFGTRSLTKTEKMVGTRYVIEEHEGAPANSFFRFGTNPSAGGGLAGSAGHLAGTGFGNFYLMFHF